MLFFLYTRKLESSGSGWGPLERTGRGGEAGFMQRKAGLSYGLSVLAVGARIIDVQGSGSPDSSHSLLLQCLPCQPSWHWHLLGSWQVPRVPQPGLQTARVKGDRENVSWAVCHWLTDLRSRLPCSSFECVSFGFIPSCVFLSQSPARSQFWTLLSQSWKWSRLDVSHWQKTLRRTLKLLGNGSLSSSRKFLIVKKFGGVCKCV